MEEAQLVDLVGTDKDNMPPTQSQQSGTDMDALALTHAIALTESGNGKGTPNYKAVGDNGTSNGAYQWQPGNFASAAKSAGLDPTDMSPENQDRVAYSQVKAYKDKGYDPGQIASLWNSGSPNNWQNHSGTTTINGKSITYDTPAYVKKVQANYQKITSQGGSQGGNNNPLLAPLPPSQAAYQEASAPTKPAAAPESFGQKTGDVIGGVADFLFPIAKDVYKDVTGKNTGADQKGFLQQAGDLGLSALPFIPGLGEAGEIGRAGIGAAELGTDAVRGGGALSKILGGTIAKNAAVGYGAGSASNLSQGQSLGQAFTPQLSNVGGAVLGGGAAGLIKGGLGIAKSAANIDPQIETDLARYGKQANPEDVSLYNKYINTTKAHAVDRYAGGGSAQDLATGYFSKAADRIDTNTKAAGAVVSAMKEAGKEVPLGDVSSVAQDFKNKVAQEYGVLLSMGIDGKAVSSITPGSMRQIPPADVQRMTSVFEQLSSLGGKSVKNGSEVISNIRDLITPQTDIYGKSLDPLDGLFTKTSQDLNGVLRKSSSQLADANDRFHGLKDLQKFMTTTAGNRLQKGQLLLKRVFSDNSRPSLDLFKKIQDATGIDLVKHAVFAKHSIDSFGSAADKSTVQKLIEGGVAAHTRGLTSGLLHLGAGAVKKLPIADPEKIGRKLLQVPKSKGLMGNLISSPLTKTAIEASRGSKLVTGH
jgi:hypothetical protein